ncbi:MAG: CatA-like O-acetyltransferase [Oscillospiraceae bacterium]
MQFIPIDLQSWPRGQMFWYFSKMAPTGYSLTVNMNVRKLKSCTESSGIKFFPAYLWLVTKNLNKQVEFKVAEQDGVLGFF